MRLCSKFARTDFTVAIFCGVEMFWKKKDKEEAAAPAPEPKPTPAPAPPPPSMSAPPRAPEPAPTPRPTPPPTAPVAPSAPAATMDSASAGGGDLIARAEAALDARIEPGFAPASEQSVLRRTRRTALQALAADGATRSFVEQLSAGQIESALDALEQAAGQNPKRLQQLGALCFETDQKRSRRALEAAVRGDGSDFWTSIFLARLRGRDGQIDAARQAALSALEIAKEDGERLHARTELSLIAFATNNALAARGHAMEAVAAARGALVLKPGEDAERDLIGRLMLLGDAYVGNGDLAEARTVLEEALALSRKQLAGKPDDPQMLRVTTDILGKLAPTSFKLNDSASALKQAEEAASLARKIVSQNAGVVELRGAASALAALGDLKRALKDQDGAFTAWNEALTMLRQLVTLRPTDRFAHRDLWTFMWRMATEGAPSASWAQVAATIEESEKHGALDEADRGILAEAKRRAAQ